MCSQNTQNTSSTSRWNLYVCMFVCRETIQYISHQCMGAHKTRFLACCSNFIPAFRHNHLTRHTCVLTSAIRPDRTQDGVDNSKRISLQPELPSTQFMFTQDTIIAFTSTALSLTQQHCQLTIVSSLE